MTDILRHISMAFGTLMFIVVVIIGFVMELPVLVIVFRGIIAMSIGTVVAMGFFRFFQKTLYRFVAEQVIQGRTAPKAQDAAKRTLGAANGAAGGTK